MHKFVAKNDKQLGLCLKLLYTERVESQVELRLTEKNRVIYLITVTIDDETWVKLDSKYRILIG